MPELPEVETIKRQLAKRIIGKKIKAVEVRLPKLVRADIKTFKKAVIGAKVKGIRRRAKLLIWELDNGWALVMHLKMSGQIIYKGKDNKHTHLIYYFTDGSKIIHNDLRQFGYVKLVPLQKLEDLLEKEEAYGPEPLNKEFTLKIFEEILKKYPNKKIKPLLMDQKVVAGIGNLYADEILFGAGALPTRLVKNIKTEEMAKVYKKIIEILKLAIKHRGTSADLYIDAEGKKGNFVPKLKVYGREGRKCNCGGIIKRIKIGSRSAHFCPACQK